MAARLVAAILLASFPLLAQQERAHWAFVPPTRAEPPAVRDTSWPTNPIDQFVLARLETAGRQPAPAAKRHELLRRATFALTGLPPTDEETTVFLADTAADAFERLIDRLLASPHYGEECARRWLDLARCADTHGMQRDQERSIWRWRDYVIDAHNQGYSYRRFATELLAGDRLPDATVDQRVATAFLRCNPSSDEGGLIPEEFLARYAMDRTDAFGTVFLGLTVGCAQCHDHKSDPLTQRDYYRLFSWFASFGEDGNDGGAAAPAPAIAAPTGTAIEELAHRRQAVAAAAAAWLLVEPKPGELPLHGVAVADDGTTLTTLADGSVLARGPAPARGGYTLTVDGDFAGLTALWLHALPDEGLPARGPGRAENGNFVLTDVALAAGSDAGTVRLPFGAATAPFAQNGFEPRFTIDDDPHSGWAIAGRHEPIALTLALAAPLPPGTTRLQLTMRHDSKHDQHLLGRWRMTGSRDPRWLAPSLQPWQSHGPTDAAVVPAEANWQKRPEWRDAVVHDLGNREGATFLRRTLTVPTARRLTLALGSDDHATLWCDGEPVFTRAVQRAAARGQDSVDLDLTAGEHKLLLRIDNLGGPGGFAFEVADAGLGLNAEAAAARSTLDLARKELAAVEAAAPRCPVADELPTPRRTFVLRRGRYDQPDDEVTPGTPAFLPPLPENAPRDRRALAAWLFLPDHPLTARVHVNRLWTWLFGRGLVATPHDFGIRGSRPSHPELLDWLATEFVRSDFDERHLVRLMVTSATWRQAGVADTTLHTVDPDNVLWARANRLRLPAEAIRDQALAVSGLLVRTLFGPPVRPYQPEGVWNAVAFPGSNTEHYRQDTGDALWRRSLYTFWKRTAPPPSLTTLDAPARERPTIERSQTNTPLQALVLRNDVTFVEAARAFAANMLRSAGSDDERLVAAWRRLLQRVPEPAELAVLRAALVRHRQTFADDRIAATALIAVGASPRADDLDPAELAAWTLTLGLLLNLDEALHRG
ncbi:MAG: DUF1553 domain-containing protein [Planctomycetes bacterium]|nr:DUF1553 domain-containing protein [Planctomycetota bacterium]